MPVWQKDLSSLKEEALLDLEKITNGAAPEVVYQESEKELHHRNK